MSSPSKEKLVCRIKTSVAINLRVFDDVEFTKGWVTAGSPRISQQRGDYSVVLYGKECGTLDPDSSKALLSTKANSATIQAFVAMDQDKHCHCMVAVNVLALEESAQVVISGIASCYGSSWDKFLAIPSEFLKDRNIAKFLWNMKQLLSSGSSSIPSTSNPTSTIEVAKKRIKLDGHSISTGNPDDDHIITPGENSIPAYTSVFVKTSPKQPLRERDSLNFSTKADSDVKVPVASDETGTIVSNSTASLSCTNVHVVNKSFSTNGNPLITSITNGNPQNPVNTSSTNGNHVNMSSRSGNPLNTFSTSGNCVNTSSRNGNSVSTYSTLFSKTLSVSDTNTPSWSTVSSNIFTSQQNIANCSSLLNPNIPQKTMVPKIACVNTSTAVTASISSVQNTNLVGIAVKQEPVSPQKVSLATPDTVTTINTITLSVTQIKQEHVMQASTSTSHSSRHTTIDGQPTRTSDLPDSIIKRLEIIDRDVQNNTQNNNKDSNGLPSLLEEGGSMSICNFLLKKNGQSTSSSPIVSESDEEEDLHFPSRSLSRRRRKRRVNDLSDDDDNDESPDDVIEVCDDNGEPVLRKDELDEIFDLMSEFPKDIEAKPCRSIHTTMLPHQKFALNWMMQRENTNELPPFWECICEGSDYFNLGTRRRIFDKPESVNGGILADDMGLGKTLTTIALILTNHVAGKTVLQTKNALPTDASQICESDLKFNKKKIKTSSTTKSDFKKPGFQFRQIYLEKITKKKKSKNREQKSKQEDNMFDNDDVQSTDINKTVDTIINSHEMTCRDSRNDNKIVIKEKSTLIICPMSVLSNWTNQFQQHVDPSLKINIYLYYGPERVRDNNFLKKHDIIITTYGTLTGDYRGQNLKGKPSPLHTINWLRVVLDEGHVIRNCRSQQSMAVMGLMAKRRWILTGTVIQNRMTDLWSMIKFLRVEPFTNKKWWKNHVTMSIERKANPGEICFNRVQKLIKHIAIRRLKTDKINDKPMVSLPKREVEIKWVTFSEEEQKVYDAMQKDGKFIVSKYFRMNTVMKNYANVLVIIMRLRQLCCHPKLCTKAIKELDKAQNLRELLRERMQDEDVEDAVPDNNAISEEDRERLIDLVMQLLSSGDSEECSICLDPLQEPVVTRCAHIYCASCINEVIESSDAGASCPLCRSDIDQNSLVTVPVNEENDTTQLPENTTTCDDETWQSSAKVDLLVQMLKDLRTKEPEIKSLVVSQFTSFLDVIEKPLKDAGFLYCRLDGRMNQKARVQVMDEFKESDGPSIMLLSLTAGGVGLNLTSASRVFLLDPAWNPAVEEQCFDRCHRLGQTKDVKVYKFIVKNSVEDRMLILQDKKRELMQKAFGTAHQSPGERRRQALQVISTLLDINVRQLNPDIHHV